MGLQQVKERSKGVMISGMIGDALGAPVEGWPSKMIEQIFGKVDQYFEGNHMGVNLNRKGMYTDDTNSTLALACSLVRMEGKIILRHVMLR